MDSTNILYGKKWAVCGDSFTNGDFSGGYSETFEDGPFAGKYKTYGYLIAERNHMTVQHLAVGGQTRIIHLGTIDDTDNTTFYGAWNVVLEYLIAHHPYAHIGILVSNGCETDDYRLATIEVAKKWGIPYIDLNGDERTPMMHRSTNPAHCDRAKELRMEAFKVGGRNSHPNIKAHLYESWFIEDFLRIL